jgi:hypothetical protein
VYSFYVGWFFFFDKLFGDDCSLFFFLVSYFCIHFYFYYQSIDIAFIDTKIKYNIEIDVFDVVELNSKTGREIVCAPKNNNKPIKILIFYVVAN